jgi:hypothetical protein
MKRFESDLCGIAGVAAKSCRRIASHGNPGVGIFLCNDVRNSTSILNGILILNRMITLAHHIVDILSNMQTRLLKIASGTRRNKM